VARRVRIAIPGLSATHYPKTIARAPSRTRSPASINLKGWGFCDSLSSQRERLEALLRKGKSPAQRMLKARILLKADVSEAGEGRSDSRITRRWIPAHP
jgi:hypothetical protein